MSEHNQYMERIKYCPDWPHVKRRHKFNGGEKMELQILAAFIDNNMSKLTWKDWERRFEEITGLPVPDKLPKVQPSL